MIFHASPIKIDGAEADECVADRTILQQLSDAGRTFRLAHLPLSAWRHMRPTIAERIRGIKMRDAKSGGAIRAVSIAMTARCHAHHAIDDGDRVPPRRAASDRLR